MLTRWELEQEGSSIIENEFIHFLLLLSPSFSVQLSRESKFTIGVGVQR